MASITTRPEFLEPLPSPTKSPEQSPQPRCLKAIIQQEQLMILIHSIEFIMENTMDTWSSSVTQIHNVCETILNSPENKGRSSQSIELIKSMCEAVQKSLQSQQKDPKWVEFQLRNELIEGMYRSIKYIEKTYS